jgi:hypothetical protein
MHVIAPLVVGILLCPHELTAQDNQQPAAEASVTQPPAESQGGALALQSQMKDVLDEVRQLREENRALQKRVSDLEGAKGEQAAARLTNAVLEARTPAPAPAPQTSAKSLAEAPPTFPMIQPFGEFGLRYEGLFNQGTPAGYTNIENQPQVMGRFGIKGQINSRISYLMRLSTGISTIGADPWTSFADPGDRRFVGFDEYNVIISAFKGERLSSTIIGGKVANVPAAKGTTEMLVDEDFGLPMFAHLAGYNLNSKAKISLLTAIGFVTNDGANVVDALDRQLYPVVGGYGGGQISDVNQNGPPRANAYVAEVAGDYQPSPSVKLRGSFEFLNVSHANDVPLFEGATGLLGIDGLRLAGMPDGTSTNLPAVLPVDSNGIVSITGPALPTALVTYRDASAYRIVDGFGGITLRSNQRLPVRLFGEWSHNIGAGDNITGPATAGTVKALAQHRGDGLVLGFEVGDATVPGHFATGYKLVLIQSDAMLDYVNCDQWHTNIRGHDFTFKYSTGKYVTPFATLVVGQNYDGRLVGFSSLATYPARDLRPGEDPWMWRPRAGVLFTF